MESLPAVAVAAILFGIWSGVLDGDVVNTSVVNQFGVMVISIALVHLGTLIPIKVLLQQWQAVLIAVGGLVIALTLILTIVTAVFDYPTAVSGSGPIAGGILAMLITTQALQEQGLQHLIVIPAAVIGLQGLVGIPLASGLLRRYALCYKASEQFALATGHTPPRVGEGDRGRPGASHPHPGALRARRCCSPSPRSWAPSPSTSASGRASTTACEPCSSGSAGSTSGCCRRRCSTRATPSASSPSASWSSCSPRWAA